MGGGPNTTSSENGVFAIHPPSVRSNHQGFSKRRDILLHRIGLKIGANYRNGAAVSVEPKGCRNPPNTRKLCWGATEKKKKPREGE